jgi:membrane protease YdiL (CAAX protease family)
MSTMRQYLATVLGIWIAACIAAYFFSQQYHIPLSLTTAIVPAFLLELAFYTMPGFEGIRQRFAGTGTKLTRAALLTGSAIAPYLLLSLGTHTFAWIALAKLAVAAGVISFFYARVRLNLFSDLLFLAAMGAVYLSSFFDQVYIRPMAHADVNALGKLMWIRTGLLAVLCIRGLPGVRFSWWPEKREWRIGVEMFLLFMPVGAVVAYAIGFARFRTPHLIWWMFPLVVAGTFAAFLWVVALAEEFFFRAFLQQSIARAAHNETLGLIAASVLFGLSHLPAAHRFPNWRFATLGFLSGIFYGIAFIRAKSVRASMVTHALVVTVWRIFFSG